MDPFELQLQGLFESCSDCEDGCLGSDGVRELCERLEITQHCDQLKEALFTDAVVRVTFKDFKDALIKFLGTFAPQSQQNESPPRDLSPKHEFGKKKYGRRSRPDASDCEANLVDGVEACSVTELCAVKKRRTDDEIVGADSVSEKVSSEEEMLVAAWATVATPGGKLSRDQLVCVFQAVGLQNGSEEAASSVFEKLELGNDGITLNALLAFIRGGVPLCKDSKHQNFCSTSVDYIEHSSGKILGQSLIEIWESSGITDSAEILHSIGCKPSQLCEMSAVISRLHGMLQTAREDKQTPLLRAGLILQRAFIQSLKSVVDQMTGEKEKLRADVIEANERAQLLAQEVDDHHARLEAASLRRVKSLEQKHAERIRELTDQVKIEQEQLVQQNQELEKRILVLETEAERTKVELNRLHGDNTQLHEEHKSALDLLRALELERDRLSGDVQELTTVRMKLRELEDDLSERDVSGLLERVAGLEGENRHLRDRNDELALQVEDLTTRLHSCAVIKSTSPSNSMNLSVDAAMREVPSLSVDDGGVHAFSDVECDDMEGECEVRNDRQNKSSVVEINCVKSVETLSNVCESFNEDTCVKVTEEVENVNENSQCNCSSLQSTITSLQEDLSKLKEEDGKLRKRCTDLEKSLELLQEEYEKTEDYWTSKLDEERSLYDAEQKLSDEKYSELVNKILEYETLMKEEVAARQRLETIEEKDGLEKQVQELEEEYSKLLSEKDSEIQKLHLELNSHPTVSDALAQTDFSVSGHSDGNNQPSYCRRSLTFSSGDRRRHCCKLYRLQGEVKSLLEAKQSAQTELSALLAERDLLYKQVVAKRREASCSANLSGKLLCAERRCRSLMSTLRNQQLQTAEVLRSTWQQHKRETEELRAVLAHAEGKIQQQSCQIQQHLGKLSASDHLVKDLFCENAYLLSAVRSLEAKLVKLSH